VATHPDVRALLQAGKGHGGRLAVVVHGAHVGRARAEELVGLLRAARWRAAALPADVPLADRWDELIGRRARVAATAPTS
jgi:hypothetical protein